MQIPCKYSKYFLEDLPEEYSCAAEVVKKRTTAFAQYSMEKARGFSILDYSILKTALFSLGLLLGAQFSKFFRRYRFFVFLSFLCSYLYLIWRIFLRDED